MNSIRIRTTAAFAVVALLGGVSAFALFRAEPRPAQEKPQPKPDDKPNRPNTAADEAAIQKASEVYADAFFKGDLDRLMALWTADADYINDDGKSFRGRDAIAAEFKRIMAESKGYKMNFRTTSLRFPKPDIALEDGIARGVSASGEVSTGRYTAVWVKNDGKWLLSSVRDLPGDVEEKASASQKLKELAWLVGEWTGEGTKIVTQVTCRWAPNQTFLVMDYTISKDGVEKSAHQRIGWDPVEQTLRSWTFDSAGGFGEGTWTREGNRWTVHVEGKLPDGRTASGVNVYQFVDEGTLLWQAKDREIDGQPVADVQVKFTKKSEKK